MFRKSYKKFVLISYLNISESDNEILRQLYGKKFDIPKTIG